jgi:PilZ domain
MEEDRRDSRRFLFSEPVAYAQPEITVNGSVAGNVSLTGMSLRVQEFVPMGVILELQMRLGKSPQVLWVKAQVVRIREVLSEDCFEIGLKFIKDEECIKTVGEYINSCRSKSTQQNKES